MKLYRFRSIEALLDEYHELENQTIYFASPDQLNDPMEGLRDIVWRGDEIVWTNLFKDYIYGVHACHLLLTITRSSAELDLDTIPIPDRRGQPLIPHIHNWFDDIWDKFLNLPKIEEIIEALSNRKRKIRYRELESYLRAIQVAIAALILESDIAHSPLIETEEQELSEGSHVHLEMLEHTLAMITELEKIETEQEANAVFLKVESYFNNHRISRYLNSPRSLGKLDQGDQLFFDFPKKYLKNIESLLGNNWYTACFIENYHNSSVWGNYGDKHRGACLIFETVNTGTSNSLELHEVTSRDVRLTPFFEVRYADKPSEVDFFRSIVGLSLVEVMKLWYTDEEGNISECASHLPPIGDLNIWLKNYRDSFFRDITTKTKDWEYEREHRLILDDRSGEFDEKKNRTLSYAFNSLKGIIFGINTSDEHKLRIIDIIQRKCEENNRTDFKFYQAHYSPETGDIRKYEIQLS